MSPTRRIAVVCAVSVMVASCGVPTGPESFEEIDASDVPNRLNDTTTTTTTTTSPPTTTTTLPTDPPETTTIPEPEPLTVNVDVYFVSRGRLAPKPTPVLPPVTATELIDLLEAGPSSDLLDNEIALNLIETTSEEDGVLTIALNERVFDRIAVRDQREAIAQIVLTFLNNLSGVGQAVFTIDGERQTVPIERSQFSDDPVSRDDYDELLVDADPDGAVDVTTSTTTTTEPEPETTEP